MKKEWIQINKKETAIKVRNTKVEALRHKNITKKGVRVFDNGCIGISGCIGDTPHETLVTQAVDNLSVGIEYPYPLESNLKDHRHFNENPMTPKVLLEHTEAILKTLRDEYPEFDFSETVSLEETCISHENTQGLDLKYQDAYYSLGLLLKDKKSANLMDGFLMSVGRHFDEDKFWAANRPLLKAYGQSAELPNTEKMPVIFLGTEVFGRFINRCFNGETYATGSSVLSGKMNQMLFNEKLTISQCNNPLETFMPFFDAEGVVLKNDHHTLVEKGILKSVFTDKRTAQKFDLAHTGAAGGDYDGMPNLDLLKLKLHADTSDLKKVLNGRPAILVLISSGGDFTPDGDYAAPVQVSFLYDGENIVGKLPELNIRSHFFKMLGEDYLGTFENEYFYIGDVPNQIFVCDMFVSR